MIKQFRIAFGLKMGSSILTFRARQDANAPEASLEARWRDRQFEKWAGLLPWNCIPWQNNAEKKLGQKSKLQIFLSKWMSGFFPWTYIPLIEQGRKNVGKFWEMRMFLSKWLSGRFSQMLVYESRESGREIIPGMHIWAQLGVYGEGLGPSPPFVG